MKENEKKRYLTEKAKQKRIKYYEENRDKILQRQKEKRLKDIDNLLVSFFLTIFFIII